jgi:hypothetical protein
MMTIGKCRLTGKPRCWHSIEFLHRMIQTAAHKELVEVLGVL